MTTENASAAIRKLGIDYQLVTDETSMLVVGDSPFSDNGVDRMNQTRTSTEHAAEVQKSGAPSVLRPFSATRWRSCPPFTPPGSPWGSRAWRSPERAFVSSSFPTFDQCQGHVSSQLVTQQRSHG